MDNELTFEEKQALAAYRQLDANEQAAVMTWIDTLDYSLFSWLDSIINDTPARASFGAHRENQALFIFR